MVSQDHPPRSLNISEGRWSPHGPLMNLHWFSLLALIGSVEAQGPMLWPRDGDWWQAWQLHLWLGGMALLLPHNRGQPGLSIGFCPLQCPLKALGLPPREASRRKRSPMRPRQSPAKAQTGALSECGLPIWKGPGLSPRVGAATWPRPHSCLPPRLLKP